MDIINHKKILKLFLLIGIIFLTMIISNSKVYALNIPSSTIYVKSSDLGNWAVGNSTWTVKSSNSKVVRVWRREDRVYYEALEPGTAYIYIYVNEFFNGQRKIIVSKPDISYLTVDRKTSYDVSPLFVDFEKEWDVNTKYGWSVSSPPNGIITITEPSKESNYSCSGSGKLKFKALRSDISYISGNPGLTTITIKENYTGVSKTFYVRVKPYVTSLNISGYKDAVAGTIQNLTLKTYPQNYVGMKEHGSIKWTTNKSDVATVDSNGKVTFLKSGRVRITATYSDGLKRSDGKYVHGTPSAWVDYVVSKLDSRYSNLKIKNHKNNTDVDQNKKITIIQGFSGEWDITSFKGWTISSPNNKIIDLRDWKNNVKNNKVIYTATNVGETTITIQEKYTEISKTFTIEVVPYVTHCTITNKKREAIGDRTINVKAGDVETLEMFTYPQNYGTRPGFGTVTWSSDNNSIISTSKTSDNKLNITFKEQGTVTITGKYKDGHEKHGEFIKKVTFVIRYIDSKLSVKYEGTDSKVKLTEEVFQGYGKKWTIGSKKGWTISSPPNGIIDLGDWQKNIKDNIVEYTAINPGETTITIKELYTGVSVDYKIKVLPRPTKIKITNKNQDFKVGKEYQLNAVTSPNNYVGMSGYGKISWTSSNPNIVYVNNTGKIRTLITGSAKITVKYELKDLELTDEFMINTDKPTRTKLVDFIKSQIGKTGAECQGYYHAGRDAEWCCYFLGYCIDSVAGNGTAMEKMGFVDSDSGIRKDAYGSDAGDITRAAEERSTTTNLVFHRYGDGYIPKAGDIFMICTNDSINDDTNKSDWRTHVGFVSEDAKTINGQIESFQTIEGNANNEDPTKSTVAVYRRKKDERANVTIENNKEKLGNYSKITASNRNGVHVPAQVYGFIDVSYYFK